MYLCLSMILTGSCGIVETIDCMPDATAFAEPLASVHKRRDGVEGQHDVSAQLGITRQVFERQGCLVLHVLVLGQKQLDEDGHGAGLDHVLCVIRGAGGDIREGPGCLELKSRVIVHLEELDEAVHHARFNYRLNRRVLFCFA